MGQSTRTFTHGVRLQHNADVQLFVQLAVVIAAFFYCYSSVFAILIGQWMANDVYSYGVLIPPIAFYIAARCWRKVRGPVTAAPVIGTAMLLVGVTLLLAGRALGVVDIQEISLLPTIGGVILLFGGPRALRALWLPVAYLSLMMPVWDVVTDRLHYPFQLLSATLATKLLYVAQVPVHHVGTYLELPTITLEVARLCSGVNYLIGVGALSVPAAYLVFGDPLRRALLLFTALGIAILANAVRIALIGILLYYRFTTEVHGPGHILQGVAVAIVGYAALFSIVLILTNWRRRADLKRGKAPADPAAGTPAPSLARPSGRVWTAAVAAIAVFVLAGTVSARTAAPRLHLGAELAVLPLSIGPWHAEPTHSTESGEVVSPEIAASRVYRDPRGRQVQLYLGAVLGGPSEGDGLRADAFTKSAQSLPLHVDSFTVLVNQSRGPLGSRTQTVLFWYDVQGAVVTDAVTAKLLTVWHRLRGTGRTPFAVIVAPWGPDGEDEQIALATMTAFAQDLMVASRTSPSREPPNTVRKSR